MKRSSLLALSSAALVSSVLFTGNAFAASTTDANETVWAIKDITQQEHATITDKVFGTNGNVISSQTVNAPSGSLVEFDKETLAQAQENGQDYLVSSQPIGSQLDTQLTQLHQKFFNQLHPTGTATSNGSLIQSATSAGGQIGTGFDSGIVDYTVTYTNSGSNVTLNNFSTYQAQGDQATYEWEIDWENTSHTWSSNNLIPTSSSNPLTYSLGWSGTQGQDFYDNVVGSNIYGTVYQGYMTIN